MSQTQGTTPRKSLALERHLFVNVIGPLAGVDYGVRRIGLALCDPGQRIASPAASLDAAGNPTADAGRVAAWLRQHAVVGAVVGLPLNMDTSLGPQARLSQVFAQRLREASALPVELWDERLSSFQADQWLSQHALTRTQKRRRRDALAAVAFLQSFLDARRRTGPPKDPSP